MRLQVLAMLTFAVAACGNPAGHSHELYVCGCDACSRSIDKLIKQGHVSSWKIYFRGSFGDTEQFCSEHGLASKQVTADPADAKGDRAGIRECPAFVLNPEHRTFGNGRDISESDWKSILGVVD